jgi:hypothetical protein
MTLVFARLAAFTLLLVLIGSACNREPAAQVVRGLVVNVQVASFSQIGAFDLHADDGQTLTFTVEGNPGITPSHLREHMVLAEPVTVIYHRSDDQLVATRIDD